MVTPARDQVSMGTPVLQRFRKNRGAVIGAAIVVVLVVFALLAPWLVRYDPNASDFLRGRNADGTPVFPSHVHLLGTDRIYRDQLARLAFGARLSLEIGFAASAISLIIGAVIGILGGFYEGRGVVLGPLKVDIDGAMMRFIDVALSFPFLLLVMAIGAAVDKTTITTILLVLGFTSWPGAARVVRSKAIQVRDLDFIAAARALGQPTLRIMWLHVLPNVSGVLIVIGTISVAQMILAESVLSYLNVGVQPPTATWGRMLFEAKDYYAADPWLLGAPGAAILLAVLGFNLLGEGLRDALDPREP